VNSTGAPRRLLDRVRDAIRLRHYSIRTEDTYVDWARRFILFHSKRHPETHRDRLPVVLMPSEVRALLHELSGTSWLVAALLYGTGMRLLEGLRLRVKDVDFERRELVVAAARRQGPCHGLAGEPRAVAEGAAGARQGPS
jgi:integrase